MQSPVRTLIFAVVASTVTASVVLAGDEFVGTWKGYADGQTAFVMALTEENGKLTGSIDIPSQGVTKRPLGLEVDGTTLKGSFSFADGTETSFTGTLQEDGSVAGTYTQSQTSGSFSMKRAEPAREE